MKNIQTAPEHHRKLAVRIIHSFFLTTFDNHNWDCALFAYMRTVPSALCKNYGEHVMYIHRKIMQ